MRLEQLKYFVEVLEGKSINKTAECYFISQSAVSDSLKKLEQEVGVPLLNKNHSGVTATLAGQEFYQIAKQMLNIWETGIEQISKYKEIDFTHEVATIQMAVSHGLGIYLGQLLKKLTIAYPQTPIAVQERDFYSCLHSVADETADFAIILAYDSNMKDEKIKKLIDENSLITDVILRTKASVIISKMSPLATKKQISIYEVLKHPLAILNTNMEHQWMAHCLKPYGTMNVSLITDNLSLFLKYITENPTCIALGSNLLESHLEDHVCVIPLKEDIYIDAFYISKQNYYDTYQAYRILTNNFFKNLTRK